MFKKLKLSITAHSKSEEGSIYPAYREIDDGFVEEGIKEHQEIDGCLTGWSKRGSAIAPSQTITHL